MNTIIIQQYITFIPLSTRYVWLFNICISHNKGSSTQYKSLLNTSLYSIQVSIQYKSLLNTSLYSIQVSTQHKSLLNTSLYSTQVSTQYKSLLNTSLYSIQVSTQYKSLLNTSLYSIQVSTQYKCIKLILKYWNFDIRIHLCFILLLQACISQFTTVQNDCQKIQLSKF